MSIERLQITTSIEELKEVYKRKLNSIIYKQLTVENIDTFANDALKDLICLTDEIVKEYKNNESLEPNINLNPRGQEDDAFTKLGLLNISETLQTIIDVKTKIDSLKNYIQESSNEKSIDEVLIPPKPNDIELIIGSGIGFKEKKLISRLLTLLYIIETDFDILKEDIKIIEGETTSNMVRKIPYTRVEIPDMERIVYICDEEGNASYVFDTEKLTKENISIEDIDISNKIEINNLISQHPGIGIRVIQTKDWRTNISELLRNPIPVKIEENEESFFVSEFNKREEKEFLLFEDFQTEVKALYSGENNVQKWYFGERKNHPNWPSNPPRKYFNKGWIDWSGLVGRENPNNKEFLSFGDFQTEIRTLYPGEGDVEKWYRKEREKHQNWPANPDRTYKNKGWTGFSELVGRENPNNKEFLSFEAFQIEVKFLYPGKGNVEKWYRKEREKHQNWPSQPPEKYANSGWIGFPELVGKDNQLKKEYLLFEAFQAEVKALYPEKGDIQKWYNKERKKHPNWPSQPYKIYANKGWIGLSELVGRENPNKREFLLFEAFQAEVRTLYPGEGGIVLWYRKEREKHPNWPRYPDEKYFNKGWVGWLELVGKK